jgi:3-methyl-2-oxobutanoate hydroxymethyltransferase
MKVTVQDILGIKRTGGKVTMLTCYDYPMALLEDRAGVDVQLVGDSVGTNVLGYPDEKSVTMDDMLHHLKAVARGAQHSFVLCDMPFRSYTSPEQALANARRLMAAGADGVKIEGEQAILPITAALVEAGIPVCGHIGYTPQTVGIRAEVQGKDFNRATELITAAQQIERAGACMIVLELIPEALARIITGRLNIPTIGIGGGRFCDGQVQVIHDIAGLSSKVFRHTKAYDRLGERYLELMSAYAAEVRQAQFPTERNASRLSEETLQRLNAWLAEQGPGNRG